MKIYAAQKPGERGTCYGGGAFGQYAAVALALFLTLASCASPDRDVRLPPVALSDLPSRLIEVYCGQRCLNPASAVPDDECAFQLGTAVTEGLRQRIRLVELGRLAYDGDNAAECLAGLTCQNAYPVVLTLEFFLTKMWNHPSIPDACARVFTGSLPIGEACEDDAECATGRCWGATHAVCTLPVAHGKTCGVAGPCAEGDVCLFSQCTSNTPLPLHAKCDTAQNIPTTSRWNDFAASQLQCADGTRCIGASEHDGNCQPIQKDGGHCTDWSMCLSGSDCVNGTCVAQGPTASAPHCGPKTCQTNEYCASDSTTCAPWAHAGETCAGGQRCLNSVCLTDSKVCSVGNPCGPSCAPSLCRADGVCLEPRIGDSCTTDKDCATPQLYSPTLTCVSGRCYRTDNPASSWL